MENDPDLSNDYMAHTTQVAQAGAVEDLLSRVRSRAKPQAEQPLPQLEQGVTAPTRVYIGDRGSTMQAIADHAMGVAKDLGTGFHEAVPAAASGVYDATYNAVHGAGSALNSVGDWLNQHIADLRIPVPLTGNATLDSIIANPTTGIPGAMPDKPPPEQSVTGSAIREGARFMTGFQPALGVLGHSAAGVIGAGALSDAVTMDPNQQGLSNLIQAVPALQNPVSEYLSTDPNSPEAVNRLRHAVEGAGFGGLTEGIVRGVRAVAAGRAAEKAIPEIQAQKQLYGEVNPQTRDTLMVASPDKSLVVTASPADKLRQAREKIDASGLGDKPGRIADAAQAGPEPMAPTAKAGATPKETEQSLFQFLRGVGGLKADPELKYILDNSTSKLVRNGDKAMSLDRAREAAVEAGYLPQDATVRDFLDAVSAEAGGNKQFRQGYAPAAGKQSTEGFAEEVNRHLDDALKEVGLDPAAVDDATRASVVAHMQTDSHDVLDAYEKVIEEQTRGVTPLVVGSGEAPKSQIYINFARMSSPDDVKQVIADMADAFKGDINEARRGVQTNAETKKLADGLGMTVDDLLARNAGQPFNAEQALAARRLLDTSATRLLELAQKAADPNAAPADLFNFRRMMAVHHAIQSEVIAARTETARALQSWAIPAGGNVETARNVQMMLEQMGGAITSQELARRMALLASQGVPPGAMANMVKRGWAATSVDAVKEAFVMGLLWSPSTHIVNSASNLAVAFQQIYERGAASKISAALGAGTEGVAEGEAIAMAYGLISSLKDAWRLGWRSLRTGESGAASMLGKVDLPHEQAISSGVLGRELGYSPLEMQRFTESPMGRAVDFIGAATRAPGRLLGAEDDFFKTLAYRAEVHAQSLRQATQEGLSGQAKWARMLEIANNPPEHIRISSADAALYSTFNNKPGEWAEALMKLRQAGSLNPTFLVLPFIRTPANILRYTFERTPLAPLVGQWRADIAAGGARRDLALARLATGTAIISVAMDYASSGIITGPGPTDKAQKEALMRTGWQPWSVYYGGKYYSYNRTDPLGTLIAGAATIAELVKAKDMAPEDFDSATEVMAHLIGGASQAVVDKTFFRGVTQFLDMLHGSEQGDGTVSNYLNQMAGSLLPMSTAFDTVRRATTPARRDVNSPLDAVMAKIPGLADNLPPQRDLWGREMSPDQVYGRAYDVVSPVATTAAKASPIDAEMVRNQTGVQRITKKGDFGGAKVDFRSFPQVYDEYVRLAGNDLKHPAYGLGAKDFLDAVVSGKHPLSGVYQMYSDGPEGGKAAFIKHTVAEYRKLAQQEIMSRAPTEWPDFAQAVNAAKDKTFENKLPIPMQGGKVPRPNITPPAITNSKPKSVTGLQAQ